MAERDSDRYLDPYRQAVERYGPGFKATLWHSAEAQRLRFDVLIDQGGLMEGAPLVLDVGCGHGDLAEHLIERGIDFRSYIGIDALPELIQSARARNLERCRFEVADPVADPRPLASFGADVATLSGTLNTMDDEVARSLVSAAYEASSRGVVFNFLSNRAHPRWAGRELEPARRFDTASWLDWSLGVSSRVSFTQAYLDGHDATIAIMRD